LVPVSGPATRGANRSEAVRTRLDVLAEETRSCTRCALHQGRSQAVFARGTGSSGLVFIGEGPGEEEDRQGFPFVGPAGQLLDRMIGAMELGRDEVYVCNIVKCRPPKNRKPEPDEMSACFPFLDEQLSLIEPRVIVALGATAVQGLLGTTEGITRMRGQWKLYRGQIPVMPTFHPAYLLRTPAAKRDVWKDLQEVLRRMRGSDAPA
jgi:DNA polymerase